ncbi:MAG: copper resistance protein CopC [Renibacterium sp.]|nr:copper resistance protein CopC [Renibacterium sp.]
MIRQIARTASAFRLSRRFSGVLVLLGLLAALLLPAGAANAHDVVENTSPSAGATVASMPSEVTLTMDNVPAAIGSKVEVKDASGADWAQDSVTVLDKVVTQKLRAGAPAGGYTVNWRLVSSDGHPIEGTFSFTATGSGGASAAPDPGTSTAPSSPGTVNSANPAPAPAGGFPWLIVVIAVVALLIIAGLVVVVRRNLAKDQG